MTAYYNEFDPFAAEWLRQLIKAGVIAPGIVDERSILDVSPRDLKDFTQCHFFAGIGVWSYALRQAGWDDSRPVWTGSCPCQPFSAAGAGLGFADERHLWPAFHYLIEQCRPGVVFGEQVASKDGRTWLDHVQTDMENLGFAIGAIDTCAAGFGAPHIRQRLFIVAERVANTDDERSEEQLGQSRKSEQTCEPGSAESGTAGRMGQSEVEGLQIGEDITGVRSEALESPQGQGSGRAGDDSRLENADRERCEGFGIQLQPGQQGQYMPETSGRGEVKRVADPKYEQRERRRASETGDESRSKQRAERLCDDGGLADASGKRPHEQYTSVRGEQDCDPEIAGYGSDGDDYCLECGRNWDYCICPLPKLASCFGDRPGPTNGFWRDPDWLFCRDGKWRPVRPGSFPLVDGASNRVGRLRGYGNAINAEVAKAFIKSYLEA